MSEPKIIESYPDRQTTIAKTATGAFVVTKADGVRHYVTTLAAARLFAMNHEQWARFHGSYSRSSLGEINGVPVRCVYRATLWTRSDPVRLFVTEDGKIWIGYGACPERFSHIAYVGDRGSDGTSRHAILRAANA